MPRLVSRLLPALLTGVLVVAGCGGEDDLTVAVGDDVRGARIDAAPVPTRTVPAETVPAETAQVASDPVAAAPTGERPQPPAADHVPLPAEDVPAGDATGDRPPDASDAPLELPLGDVPTSADEVVAPAVDEPSEAGREQPLDIPVPDEDDWKPEPPKPPVLKDGVWRTSFDYLGSFDVGLDAIDAGSPLAQHTPKVPLPEGAPEPEKGFPEAVRKMDGQKVRIEGYMIPLKFEDGAVKSFFLSRYMMGCCFGVLPKANEVIEVEMAGDKGAYYDAYMPFVVVGTLEIVEDGTSPEFLQSVFRVTADSCEYVEDW